MLTLRVFSMHLQILVKHRDEPMYPGAVENWERATDKVLAEAAQEVCAAAILPPAVARLLLLFVTYTRTHNPGMCIPERITLACVY